MRALLGTYVEISAMGLEEVRLGQAIGRAFDAVERVHRLMSPFCPGSDLSRINRSAWLRPVDVDPWTARTLRWALAIHDATGGLFDCAVGHELERFGLVAGCGFEASEPGSLADLELTRAGSVRLARRMGIDLGGIAKGFAVDRAIATLRRLGVRAAVVNAGGDVRVMGREPQPIYVRDPGQPRTLRPVGLLANGAVATSNARTVIDIAHRAPLGRTEACSVIAPQCVVADALTKAVAQSGRLDAPWLTRFGAVALPCA
jgi:thiamine biosynthesis lipoprotein